MAKLRMAHASTHGARKPPGPTNFHAWEIPGSGSKAEDGEKREKNTPGTAGGQNIGGNKFLHTGDSPKWVKSRRRREKERKRPNDGNKNGQATHRARKHAWRLGQFTIFHD